MKRSIRVVLPALLALLALVVTGPVGALPGPDPDDAAPEFSIDILGTHEGETEVFEKLVFTRAAGWDFGDRESYRCAFVEYVADGVVQFELVFERLEIPGHDANYIVINDHNGMETGEGGAPPAQGDLCGMPAGAGPRTHDGTPLVPGGANFTVYKDNAPYMTYSLPAVAPINDESFWSVGDEPGEAYLWYIEEGEANDAVLRFNIRPVAPGVSLVPLIDHESALTLDLRGHLNARGAVSVSDGFAECLSGRIVRIERRVRGSWRFAGRDVTTSDGAYAVHLRNKDGAYRARVLEETLTNGDSCTAATSRKAFYVLPGS